MGLQSTFGSILGPFFVQQKPIESPPCRASPKYLSYFSERRLKSLIGNYLFHTEGEIPSLGDMVRQGRDGT